MSNFNPDRDRGSAIVELPPALVIVLFLAFFPMINLLWLGVTYSAGWYLNTMEAREAVCHAPIESGAPTGTFLPPNYVLNTSQNWKGFMGVIEAPDSPMIAGYPSSANPVLVGNTTVRTTVHIKPYLAMPLIGKLPWLSEIPGLGKPWTCIYTSTVVQEEQGQ